MFWRRGKRWTVAGSVTALFGAVACTTYTSDPEASPSGDAGGEASSAAPSDAGVLIEAGAGCDSTSLATNPKHCGRCGHDCGGGSCVAGVCAPVAIATGLKLAGDVALRDDTVYLTTADGVARVPMAGGKLVPFFGGLDSARGLAIDGDFVFCGSAAGVHRASIGAGAAVSLTNLTKASVGAFTVASDGLYVCDGTYPEVRRYNREVVSSPVLVAKDIACESISVQGPDVYYGGSRLGHATTGSPGKGDTLSGSAARRIASDATHVFSIASGSNVVRRTARDGSNGGVFAKCPEPIEDGELLVDETHVYWTTGRPGGGVYRAAKGSGMVETLATGRAFPVGIAVDALAVYWVERDAATLSKWVK